MTPTRPYHISPVIHGWVKTSSYHPRGFAYNRTWHETTGNEVRTEGTKPSRGRPVTMEFNFIGTAIYLSSLWSSPRLSFSLDGQPVTPRHVQNDIDVHPPPFSPVFSLRNLTNDPHKVVVTVEPGSTFLFDYLIYTTVHTTPLVMVQARQDSSSVFGTNQAQSSTQSTLGGTPSVSANSDPTSGKTQIGAIAGAIAASIGITSLFSIGLAISIIKIRRQRLRVRRERQRSEEINRSRGLALHLPSSAPHRQSTSQRRPERPAAEGQPPPYESVVAPLDRTPLVLQVPAHSLYVQTPRTPLPPIEEVPTEPPLQPSTRESSLTRENLSGGASASRLALQVSPEYSSGETLTVSQEHSIGSTAHTDHDHQ